MCVCVCACVCECMHVRARGTLKYTHEPLQWPEWERMSVFFGGFCSSVSPAACRACVLPRDTPPCFDLTSQSQAKEERGREGEAGSTCMRGEGGGERRGDERIKMKEMRGGGREGEEGGREGGREGRREGGREGGRGEGGGREGGREGGKGLGSRGGVGREEGKGKERGVRGHRWCI